MSEQTNEKIITEEELAENPALDAVVYATKEETELKNLLVNYTGNKLDEENVTVNMIAEVLASDFPEFAFAFAEENFVRGYKLGLNDALKISTGKQKTLQKQVSDFYTSSGIHVYIRSPLIDDKINLENVISKVEQLIPQPFLSEVEMILVGDFEEFKERHVSAAYKDGALYISNVQMDEHDMVDDIVHEIAHSIEEPYGYELYYDQKIKNEFLLKREQLHKILWGAGFKTPKAFFSDTEYNEELDMFLLKKVGYDKLTQYCVGLFINAYAPTSLREYFATAFTDYFMQPDGHKYLKSTSPAVYQKINDLYMNERLDNL